MNWDIIERDSDGFTAVSVEAEVNAGIERMLNKLKVIEIDWRLEELASETPSLAMQWLLTNARAEIEKSNWSECLAWLYQANCLAWHKLIVWEKLEKCVDLVYKIDPDVCPHYYWERLPVVEEKVRTLTSVLPLIRPWVEEAAKRTRQISLRFYLGKHFFRTTPVSKLDYLLCAEFISVHFSAPTVRMLVQRALLEVLGGKV